MVRFAGIWRDMPKLVYSTTLEHADWNTTIVREVVPDQVRALSSEDGGDVVVGGAGLAASLMRLDLTDEYRLYVHPVVIGQGKPAFPPSQRHTDLRLVETRAFGHGVVLLRHQRRNRLTTAPRRQPVAQWRGDANPAVRPHSIGRTVVAAVGAGRRVARPTSARGLRDGRTLPR